MKSFSALLIFHLLPAILFANGKTPLDQVKFKLSGNAAMERKTVTTPQGSRTVLQLSWDSPLQKAIALTPVTPVLAGIKQFDHAVFSLDLNLPDSLPLRRIVIRLADRKGKMFQFSNNVTGYFPKGHIRLDYSVDGIAPQASIWGKDSSKQINWPLRLQGIVIDPSPDTPPQGQIQLEAIDYRLTGENIEFSFQTGNRLNLLLPGNAKSPELSIRNTGTEPLRLKGLLTVSDTDGNRSEKEVVCAIPVDQMKSLTVPGDFSRQGCRKFKYSFRSESGKTYSGEHRFARMIPAGPTRERADGFLFGLCSHAERFPPDEAELEALAAGLCGAKILRVDFTWQKIQPSPDRWNFSTYDRLVETFGKNGIEFQCILGFAANWAIPADYIPKNPDPKFAHRGQRPDSDAFAAYARAVAKRYRNRIRYFEIWNEPDLISFANFSSSEYMVLLKKAGNAVKQEVPDAKIMNGGIASVYSNRDVKPYYNNGVLDLLLADNGKHFDLFAYHGHGPFSAYREHISELKRCGMIASGKPWGWYSNETAESSAKIGELKQAESLFKKLIYARANGAIGFNWYNLREKGFYPEGHHERHFGLITPEFEPKPAYVTYNMLASLYRGGGFLQPLSDQNGLCAFLFQNDRHEKILALWSDDLERPCLISGLPQETRKVDLWGNESPVTIRNGITWLKLSGTPFSLKLPANSPENPQLHPFVTIPGRLFFGRDRIATVPVTVENQTPQNLKLDLKLELPEHLSSSAPVQHIAVTAKEKRTIQFPVKAAPEFSASTSSPAHAYLELTPEGWQTERFPITLIQKNKPGTPAFLLNRYEQYFSFIPSAPGNESLYWQGPQDLSAKIYLTREGQYLHLKAEVTDDHHAQPYQGEKVWQGDGIQFAVRLPGQNRMWKFGLTRLSNGKPEVFCWLRPDGVFPSWKTIRLSVSRDEKTKTTSYEARIPFAVLGLNEKIISNGFHFNLLVNDNDGTLRKGFLSLAPGLDTEQEEKWPIVNLD